MGRTKPQERGRLNLPRENDDETKPTQCSKNRRESIESFVVVFVAFLVFSLEAEGFVIPTGSMAPTLMGRHKEIVCPECGEVYTVNADCEVDSDGSAQPRAFESPGEPARIAASPPASTKLPATLATASTP